MGTIHEDVFHDGDTVDYWFKTKTKGSTGPYEYIREDGYWPGRHEWSSLTDADIVAALLDERVRFLSCGLEPPPEDEPAIEGPGGAWMVLSRDTNGDRIQDWYLFRDELQARRKADEASDSDRYYTVLFVVWSDA